MQGFTVIHRNPHHWDIYQNNRRIFKIRGDKGNLVVIDNKKEYDGDKPFKTVQRCMNYITDLLMFEK